jgi:hypothetical protein
MQKVMTKRKKILIAIPTILITALFLFACWYYLSENVFVIVLVVFCILGSIAEPLIIKYEKRKMSDLEQKNENH